MYTLKKVLYLKYKHNLPEAEKLLDEMMETYISFMADGGRQEVSLSIGGQSVSYDKGDPKKLEMMIGVFDEVICCIKQGRPPKQQPLYSL